MAQTTADVLADRLIDWGVRVVFGLPGDGINGIMEALRTRQDRITFVQVRHEESAAFMACAYAKYTGRLGVCLATSGPGAIHLLNGLYDAKMDGAPVLALTGQTYHDLIGTRYQQEVDLLSLFKDVAVYNQQVLGAGHVRALVDAGCRAALSLARRRAHHVPGRRAGTAGRRRYAVDEEGRGPHVRRVAAADRRAVRRRHPAAAAVLNAGKKTVILAGQGALGARAELEQLADLLAAPIVKPLLGKGTVPDDSPFTTGGIGLLGTEPSVEAMEQADTLLMVGTSFPYMEFYPKHDAAAACRSIAIRRASGCAFRSKSVCAATRRRRSQLLAAQIQRREDRSFLEEAQAAMKEWRALLHTRSHRDEMPLKPQVVADTLNELLADDAIISTDSGTITAWAAQLHPDEAATSCSRARAISPRWPTACPTRSPPQIAHPGRQSVAFVGDGGFTMLMGEFATAVKYRLPIKVVVIKNNVLGMIKWEQMVFLGNPEYGVVAPADRLRAGSRRRAARSAFRCEQPGRGARRARGDAARRRSGAVRSGRRSVRAADAAAGHGEAGAAHGRIAGQRRAERRPHRADVVPRQDQRLQGPRLAASR